MTKAQLETYTGKAYEVARKAANDPKIGGDLKSWRKTTPVTHVGVRALVAWILKNPPGKNGK